jgi:recombination protein RecR
VAGLPESLRQLMASLSRLPGIGPRSAERLALFLAQAEAAQVRELAQDLLNTRDRIHACPLCGSLTETDPCWICGDARREAGLVCVVERPTDVLSIEKTGSYRGKYHVLGGKLSPVEGIGPEDLRIAALVSRVGAEPVREVILALGSDVEGDATCHYLAQRLVGLGVRVSRIAQGLPVGSGLEYADELTLGRAIEGRRQME